MSDTVIYCPPNEGRIWNPPLSKMIEDILERDKRFWSAGVGCGSIFMGEDLAAAPSLVMVYTGPLGFYVELSVGDTASIVRNSDDTDTIITLPVGQSVCRYPAAFLVAREQCAKIMRFFYSHRTADPAFNWISKKAANWSFYVDSPEEDE